MAGTYVFLLGLASGIALLPLTAYRRVSPRWLKWLLVASGGLVLSRYITMALFTSFDAPQRLWSLRHCWFATSVGLTLPSVFAIDQLVRHPAMSPKKLLRWFSPFLVAYGCVILFAPMTVEPDRVSGWTPHLAGNWQRLLGLVQGTFVISFISICVLFIRKIPSRPIQTALAGLLVAHLYLGVDGLLLVCGRWYFRPFLYSEMLTLLAIWYAYETSARLQNSI